MKRNLRVIISALLMLVCSVVGNAATGDTYKLVTDAAELKSGDIVVIASGNLAIGNANPEGTKIEIVTISTADGMLSYVDGLSEIVIEGSTGNWYMKYVKSGNSHDGKYISQVRKLGFPSGASLNMTDSQKDNVSISVSSDGNSTIAYGSDRCFSYADDKNNFGIYSKRNVQIYKKQRRANGLSFASSEITMDANAIDGTAKNYVALSNPNNLTGITYSSSNTGVATVDGEGNVTLVHYGETTITATYPGNDSYTQGEVSYKINVTPLANGIKVLSERVSASLSNGTLQLPISNPNNLPLTYTSSDEYVATVGTDGKATLKSWGTTTITATFAGSTTYEQETVTLTLNVTDTKAGYANKIIDFVAGTDKGSTTSVDNADSMEKDVVTVHSNNAALASSPYKLRYDKGLDIEVVKGRIVRVDIEGNLGNLVYSDGGGQYDKISDGKHVWTGSAKKVSVKHKQKLAVPVEITSIRVYVEYPEEKYAEYNESATNEIEPWENTTVRFTRNIIASKWNTLCLPFDLEGDMLTTVLGEGAQIVEYKSTDADGTLKFETPKDKEGKEIRRIEAGKPYLVKPTNGIGTWTFENIEIKTDKPVTVGDGITFQGIFSPKDITEGGTVKAAGVTENAKIALAATGNEMKAFRAYFILPQTTDPSALRLSIDGTVTAISGINADTVADDADAPVYNLQGQRVGAGSLQKGVYVKNGRKFVVK